MKEKLCSVLFFGIIFVFSALCFFLPKADFSESERRVLAAFPEVSAENIFSGKFSGAFEEFATDTFPFRDRFRAIKATAAQNIFLKSDNNGLFKSGKHLSKLDWPLKHELLDHAAERFSYIYETYLRNSAKSVHLSIIPDKNHFLPTLKYDSEELVSYMKDKMPYAEYTDIFHHLALSDYYFTDSHWKQEEIADVADALLSSLGRPQTESFIENTLDTPFYGVFVGQSAKKVSPDTIRHLTNDTINSLTVTSYDTGAPKRVLVYDMEKAGGRDPYEMFLAGNSALLTVENPNRQDGSHLIVFRDSFASSLLPLMAGSYEKITAVDIRYIQSAMLGNFVDFKGADVLFLYSEGMLNGSLGLR